MTRKTNRVIKKRKNSIQKAGHHANTARYWGMPGYVHRLYVDKNPMINKVTAAGGTAAKGIAELNIIITQTEQEEDAALSMFAEMFGLGNSPEAGERILNEMVSESGDIMELAYEYLMSAKQEEYFSRSQRKMAIGFAPASREGIREDIAHLALTLFSDEDPNSIYKELRDNLDGLIRGFIQEDGKRKGKMAVSQPATIMGSLFERLMTAVVQKKYIEKIKEEAGPLTKWTKEMVHAASVEAMKVASFAGSSGATKIGYEVEGKQIRRGHTEKSYDVLVSLNENDFLPIQSKFITQDEKDLVNIVTNASIQNFLNYSNTSALEIDYLRFALIHQHYFANQAYAKAVQGVQNKLDYHSYDPFSAAKATAIELLDEGSTMDFLKPAIGIMRSSVMLNFIRGVEENPHPLIYLVGSSGGSKIIRMSTILKSFRDGLGITVTTQGELSIGNALDNFGKKKRGILSREEWYDKTNEAKALQKLKVTMSFNYGKPGNIKGGEFR